MFGERFARARGSPCRSSQEMDRRDRVTVLACDDDVPSDAGRAHAPGSPAAHDVDAFLAGVEPDGASDLVGAVRAAAASPGRDAAAICASSPQRRRRRRAGYRTRRRVERPRSPTRSRDARAERRRGADRRRRGHVTLLRRSRAAAAAWSCPTRPGERLETAALDVLNATYGATLRDVEVELPAGLTTSAPTRLAPIRAGGETHRGRAHDAATASRATSCYAARSAASRSRRSIRSTCARSSDAGNAFVPRLYAAARIADEGARRRRGARAELVALSRRFARAEPVHVAPRARERGDVPGLRHRPRAARDDVDRRLGGVRQRRRDARDDPGGGSGVRARRHGRPRQRCGQRRRRLRRRRSGRRTPRRRAPVGRGAAGRRRAASAPRRQARAHLAEQPVFGRRRGEGGQEGGGRAASLGARRHGDLRARRAGHHAAVVEPSGAPEPLRRRPVHEAYLVPPRANHRRRRARRLDGQDCRRAHRAPGGARRARPPPRSRRACSR